MASKSLATTTTRSYEDFQPSSNWVKEEDVETLVIHLPGFKKEHLRVQIDGRGNLKISGECQVEANRWSRFRKELRVPKNSNTDEITAKFTGGLLYVKFPKKIADFMEEDQQAPSQEAPTNQNVTSGEKSEHVLASGTSSFSAAGLALKLNQHRRLVLGIVVILSVGVALGIYGIYRLKSSAAGEDGN